MDPQQGAPQQDLLIGQTIGNYLVTQKVGEGGMGSVYLAEHPSIGKKVALKVLHSEFSSNQEVAARFFNEAKAVNDIGHPNIVDIVDFGIIQASGGRDQLVYFIMEYLAGQALSQLIRTEAPLPPERALAIALQVGDALAASHKCGIVHRDLKPDNIMLVARHRERDFVKLLDFGIAKLTGDAQGSRRTRTGIVMGTPAYMSPEQCEGRGNIDHRTDIYALGIVLYEMLTGRVPFLGEGYGEVLVQHLTQPPLPPSQFRMMNAHVEAVVMKALQKRPDLRYPTMDEMMRAMADPVGYVEAHGGIHAFMQAQLMPSSAPLPPIRMTPSPTMTTPTPLPGHMPTPYGLASPVPTTLGGAAGQVAPARSKTGFLIAGAIVVAAAVGAVIFVVGSKKSESAGGGEVASGSGPDGSAVGSAGSQVAAVGSGSGSADGSAVGAAGSAVVAVGSGSATGSAGGGSATTQDGSAGSAVVAERKTRTITLNTKPPGARIFVNGFELDQVTPAPFEAPVGKKVAIVLKLDGHDDIKVKPFVVTEDLTADQPEFKKKRSSSNTGRNTGRGSANRGNGNTGTGNDTGLMVPE